MTGTAPSSLQELIPRYIPVRHLRSSTQSRLRIPSVDQGNNKNTLEPEHFPVLCPNCGTAYPLLRESIIRRKLLRKTWRPTCCQRIRFAQTVHQWFFLSALSSFNKDISALYKSSSSSSNLETHVRKFLSMLTYHTIARFMGDRNVDIASSLPVVVVLYGEVPNP